MSGTSPISSPTHVNPKSNSAPLFREIFDRAVQLFNRKYPQGHPKRAWLQNTYNIDDVFVAVSQAKAEYDKKSEQSKVRKWLTKFSRRIALYTNVMDTLVSHHPEYVSLAWGTLKLLFILVMNQEELISRLAEALCEIAQVLPRVELKMATYQTDEMRRLLEALYVSLIRFFGRAIEWYQESKAKHALNAFWKPDQLRFKDLRDEISEAATRIDKLAETLMQVQVMELIGICRRMELQQQSMRTENQSMSGMIMELKKTVETNHSLTAPLVFNTHRNTCTIHFSQMLSFTALTPFADPEITLHYCNSTRKRRTRIRKSGGQHKNQAILDGQRLVTWASNPSSSLLVVRGTLDTKDETKDISTAVVDLLMTMEIPVLWVLNGKARPNGSVNSFVEVLKHLTWQALRLGVTTGPTISESFNAPLLQAIRTEAEWFNVLRILLSRFKIIYLVIDAEVLDMNGNSSTAKLLELYTYLQNFVAKMVKSATGYERLNHGRSVQKRPSQWATVYAAKAFEEAEELPSTHARVTSATSFVVSALKIPQTSLLGKFGAWCGLREGQRFS